MLYLYYLLQQTLQIDKQKINSKNLGYEGIRCHMQQASESSNTLRCQEFQKRMAVFAFSDIEKIQSHS